MIVPKIVAGTNIIIQKETASQFDAVIETLKRYGEETGNDLGALIRALEHERDVPTRSGYRRVVFLGESGMGKSTTLNILLRLSELPADRIKDLDQSTSTSRSSNKSSVCTWRHCCLPR